MRIIGGKVGGRILKVPNGLPVRPTTDKARLALFNKINHFWEIEGIRALDLFSGTGSFALEIASRGAQTYAVDQHTGCCNFIKESAKLLDLPVQMIQTDVFSYLKRTPEQPFNLIFADPPYQHAQLRLLPELVLKNWLAPEGWFILEHPRSYSFEDLPDFMEERTFGQSVFTIFERNA